MVGIQYSDWINVWQSGLMPVFFWDYYISKECDESSEVKSQWLCPNQWNIGRCVIVSKSLHFSGNIWRLLIQKAPEFSKNGQHFQNPAFGVLKCQSSVDGRSYAFKKNILVWTWPGGRFLLCKKKKGYTHSLTQHPWPVPAHYSNIR